MEFDGKRGKPPPDTGGGTPPDTGGAETLLFTEGTAAHNILDIVWRFRAVADPDQAFGGKSNWRGAKDVFACLNTRGCLRQSLCVTEKRLSFVGQKVAIFVGRTIPFSRE